MTLQNLLKAPFPWFGGKSKAAEAIWDALGDVDHYVEPFFGSGAAMLLRPHVANRPYNSETVNDLDGLLVNFWRSVQLSPQETAEAASWPVSEFDKHARGCRLLQWRESESAAQLAGNPEFHDPVMAGWWTWCVSVSIGAWGQGGPWISDEDGKLRKLSRKGLVASTREQGVSADLPHLTDDGQGVNRPGTREQGVSADLPHLGNDGQGVNRPGTREQGLTREQRVDADYQTTGGYHPLTMPELRRWFDALSARLRHVRILNGTWERSLTTGASHTIPVRSGGVCGVFLDPPYGDVGRSSLYGKHEDFNVANDVRAWCVENGSNPKYRIVYAGYDVEGEILENDGWTSIEWFKNGHLTGGMGNTSRSGEMHQQKRERLWLSPHCLVEARATQKQLF